MSDSDKEFLSGTVERVTYHNRDNGFCVLRIKVKSHKELVTVIGNVPSISAGEGIECEGIWHNDRNHGLQLKAQFIKSIPPTTIEGIEKYLGSGLIKGIGPHFAKKLIVAFGEKVFDVIENTPTLLLGVKGIGKSRIEYICKNWKNQKIVRQIMVFLQSHGVGTARATRIFKTYGEDAIEIVSENPYRLAKDIRGIGFMSADTIATNLGIDKHSIIRARAGITHVLFEATNEGHCALPEDELIKKAISLLEIDSAVISDALYEEITEEHLVKDSIDNVEAIFLSSFYYYEKFIAFQLLSLLEKEVPWEAIDISNAIPWVEKKLDINLSESQKEATKYALRKKVMVITGGPGTGKTTLINSIINILKAKHIGIKLCAPTGRAAKKLSESTKLEALTIHRLLEADAATGKFLRNENNYLPCNYLIVDEASMVDSGLFYSLLKAVSNDTALLIVGDVDQLPSVGAGQVLADIINSDVIPVVKLDHIFRQAANSKIITNAHLINQGISPNLNKFNKNDDFFFIELDSDEELPDRLVNLVQNQIPTKFRVNPVTDIQVLAPMQRGGAGVRSLNIELQKALNPNYQSGILKFGQTFAIGDKVMQTENNYDKEVYNGDIGIIKNINSEEQEITISFDDKNIVFDYSDLDQITLAYATTIHKSQGSEYPIVVIALTMQHFIMLKRNLIYTAITRGKKLVIIIGNKKAFYYAVKNTKHLTRYTKLKNWLISKTA